MRLKLDQGDGRLVPTGEDREMLLPGGARCRLALAPTDYEFHDGRFAICVDTTWDASHTDTLAESMAGLASRWAAGGFDGPDELLPVPYFLIAVDTRSGQVLVARDRSGVKTGYYGRRPGRLVVGTLMHQVAAACGASDFDSRTVWQLLLTGYINDGSSLYAGVHEVRTGEQLTFAGPGEPVARRAAALPIDDRENPFAYERNVALLREHIGRAHDTLASARDNIVLLSGGIDSAVMLAALAGHETRAVTVRVAGTQQDESPYACACAAFLRRPIRVVDLDPTREIPPEEFERTVLQMNNPYLGVWVFGQLDGGRDRTYFGGQDTRLHTPSINAVDRVLFAIGFWRGHLPARFWCGVMRGLLPLAAARRLDASGSRRVRGLYRLLASSRPAEFLRHYHLHCEGSPAIRAAMRPDEWAAVAPVLEPQWTPAALDRLATPRQLYNHIVSLNWHTQYTDDMRYMQDLARLNGTYMAMPFYDPALTWFSSGLPFRQITRLRLGRTRYGHGRTVINKVMLRDAYRADLCDEVYYRDKATSDQFVLLVRGGVGRMLKAMLTADLERTTSFIRAYRLESYVQRLFADDPTLYGDHLYMVTLHYIAALCAYRRTVLCSGSSPPAGAPGAVS